MFVFNLAARSTHRRLVALLLVVVSMLGGCANVYLDNGVREVPVSEYRRPADPHPTQVMFEFQTRGVSNASATALLRSQVIEQISGSGLFAQVSDQYKPGGAMLSLTINNIPLSDDAFLKGFVTGLTFGLAGNQVGDGYVCTIKYTGPGGAAPLTKSTRHAIYTTVGAAGAPSNGTKVPDIPTAVTTMARQAISNVLLDLSMDPMFQP